METFYEDYFLPTKVDISPKEKEKEDRLKRLLFHGWVKSVCVCVGATCITKSVIVAIMFVIGATQAWGSSNKERLSVYNNFRYPDEKTLGTERYYFPQFFICCRVGECTFTRMNYSIGIFSNLTLETYEPQDFIPHQDEEFKGFINLTCKYFHHHPSNVRYHNYVQVEFFNEVVSSFDYVYVYFKKEDAILPGTLTLLANEYSYRVQSGYTRGVIEPLIEESKRKTHINHHYFLRFNTIIDRKYFLGKSNESRFRFIIKSSMMETFVKGYHKYNIFYPITLMGAWQGYSDIAAVLITLVFLLCALPKCSCCDNCCAFCYDEKHSANECINSCCSDVESFCLSCLRGMCDICPRLKDTPCYPTCKKESEKEDEDSEKEDVFENDETVQYKL